MKREIVFVMIGMVAGIFLDQSDALVFLAPLVIAFAMVLDLYIWPAKN
jgi:hypothetical protein